jgi:ADP-ribose pyrophosphatase YjhB (NUDIX family)
MQTDLKNKLQSVLDELPDPRGGLPDSVFNFVRKITPLINVDLLIQEKPGRTLLTWREDEYGKGWHVPGGIIRFFERAADRITVVAAQELGTRVIAEESPCHTLELLVPRGHFISLLYRCRLVGDLPCPKGFSSNGGPRHGAIAWIDGIPNDLYPVHAPYQSWLKIPGR